MIKSFKDKEAEKIYNGLRSAKLPGTIQETARRRFKYLNNAVDLEDLRVPPSNHFEALSGRPGVYSIRINNHSTPASIQSIGYCPNEKVVSNISHIKAMKMGNPSHLWVMIWSNRCVS